MLILILFIIIRLSDKYRISARYSKPETEMPVSDDDDSTLQATEDDLFYFDTDGDGYGLESSQFTSCIEISGSVQLGGDCDDENPFVHPDAFILWNFIDFSSRPVMN